MLAACGLLIAACSPDPIVGTWRSDSRVVAFHDDGTLSGVQRNDPACAGETAAIAACARRQRWERSGSAYRITLMGLARNTSGGFGGMFNSSDGSPCRCVIDITATAEVHGDELVIEGGKERAHRVQ